MGVGVRVDVCVPTGVRLVVAVFVAVFVGRGERVGVGVRVEVCDEKGDRVDVVVFVAVLDALAVRDGMSRPAGCLSRTG